MKHKSSGKNKKRLCQQIEAISANAPSSNALDLALSKSPQKFILRYGNLHPLILEWARLRKVSDLIAKELRAKFGAETGSPCRRAFTAGRIDELSLKYLLASVNHYQQLFVVLQSAWEYLDAELQKNAIPNRPINQCEYFSRCLEEDFDARLIRCSDGYKAPIQRMEKEFVEIRNALWASRCVNQEIDSKEYAGYYPWLYVALAIADKESKNDTDLKKQLQHLMNLTADFADSLVQDLRKERKSSQGRIKSLKWHNTLAYEGAEGGWNLLS